MITPFSQRNMATKRALGAGVGGVREVWGGGGRNLKKVGGVGNIGERVFIK